MVKPLDAVSTAPGTGYDPNFRNTALQSHVAFFDRDNDGIIWPRDTYNGFRQIGFGVFLALLSTLIIHGGFSYLTWDSFIPDPFFRLKINRMHRAKHGSDTGAYTALGEFDQERFNYIFEMYSSPPHTHLTFNQGIRMIHGNRNPWDFFGWFAAAFEWLATYIMLWPSDPCGMPKSAVEGVYDGTIFYEIAGRKPNTSSKDD